MEKLLRSNGNKLNQIATSMLTLCLPSLKSDAYFFIWIELTLLPLQQDPFGIWQWPYLERTT